MIQKTHANALSETLISLKLQFLFSSLLLIPG